MVAQVTNVVRLRERARAIPQSSFVRVITQPGVCIAKSRSRKVIIVRFPVRIAGASRPILEIIWVDYVTA